MTEQEVLDFIQENDVKFIRLAFVDMFGTLKNISIMPGELRRAFGGGISFDASAVKGFTDVASSDLFLKPDLRTIAVLPWRPQSGRVARLWCDCVGPDGTLYEGYSRTILRRQVEKAREEGLFFTLGTEYEFYLFKQDENGDATLTPHDQAGYMDVAPLDRGENIRREICLSLEAMGIQPECSHHEHGPGQNEIDFKYASPLAAADNAMAFKSAVRTIASQYGLHASFLPKPLMGDSGNGLHVNLSMERDGVNLFEWNGGEMAEEARQAMAGILRRIREISLFLNPLPSSYRRLGEWEAPRYINWSYGNRSQCIRIPASAPGNGRMELRSPDPACNPYLAFALILAAAMEGMRDKAPLQPPVENTGELPVDLNEAIREAQGSDFIRSVIPESMLSRYVQEKQRTAARHEADPKSVFQQHLRTI